ncbi:uncharacterized protein LOC143200955 [Rhynchophorus ferrugineus]|uniref:AAA+ ATPase domain-containing protein n=1 Tax=Rhynchophorus ferrugineus TaxID=354439 RepID=A0A834ISZ8_RHYFE|nr:hypothetical protein GWI33_022164 [Rhynchophorus ferrugineus]
MEHSRFHPFVVFSELKICLKEISAHLKLLLEFMEKFMLKVAEFKTQKVTARKISSHETITNYIQHPTVLGFDDIAGLKDLKKILYTVVILPKQQPQLFYNRVPGNSILLYGPPGTGKTKLVHGIAAESGSILYCISLSDILSALVGETEKNIHEIFTQLKKSDSRCILFIDEIDGICRKRGNSEHDHSRRLKTEIMKQMNQIETCNNIVVIAATNCPWDLDNAVLRRFKKQIYTPLPDEEERVDLFHLLTRNENVFDSVDEIQKLSEMSDGLSGSDISNLVQDALDMPLNELHETKIWKKCEDGFYEPYQGDILEVDSANYEDIWISELKDLPPMSVRARNVTMADFCEAIKQVQVTVTPEDIKKYEDFQST